MIPLWAKPGVKVVCIKKTPWKSMLPGVPWIDWGETRPVYKGIYTLRDIHSDDPGFVTLVEIVNTPRLYVEGLSEKRFSLSCFRPLVSRTESEDLAVFRRIADLAGVDEALRRLEGVE